VIRIDAHHGSATIDGDIHADSTFEEQQGCPSSVDACSPSLPDTDFGLGSGGSVFITARTLAGNGTVSANGAGPVPTGNAAAGRDGAGGGGRIAVLYGDESGWSGTLEAYGGYDQLHGNSYNEVYADGTGGAGTVFTRQVTFTPKGTVSKGEGAFPDGTLTVDAGQDQWFPPPLYYAPPDATPLLTAWNDPKRRLVVTGDADVWATKLDYGEIDVTGHSTITTPPGQMFLDVTTQTLDIDATSEVTVDTRGYGWDGSGNDKGGSAPGATLSADGAGGSHGGRGGQAGSSDDNVPISGSTYDSASDPHLPGAGGSGGAGPDGTGADVDPGGGVLDVKVGTLELAGALSADGADNQGPTAVEPAIYINSASGAGAGGSILVHVATLSSTGTISADGGLACGTGGPPIEPKALSPGPCDPGPGGGGGGRVAVYAGAECSWSGSVTASGGVDQSASDQHTMPVTAGEAGSVVVTNGKGVC
jgi:hypothetical protein